MTRRFAARNIAVIGVQYYGNSKSCHVNATRLGLAGPLLADSEGKVCGSLGVGEFTVMTLDERNIIRYRGEPVEEAIAKSLEIIL